MRRSFRAYLALRATGVVAVAIGAVSVVTFVSMRSAVDAELDASILGVASIQAASLTDGGEMHFHEWELTPDEAASLQDLIRYAQVWRVDGTSLLRSRYMTEDLPVDLEMLAQAAGGRLLWREASWNGVPIRALYYPLDRFGDAHDQHVMEVAAPLVARNQLLARVGIFLLALTFLISLATYVGSWWVAGRAIRPVNVIIDQAESMEASSLGQRIHAYAGAREYHRLVDVLNGMLGRIEEAFRSQRRFTADASHELRSPLTAMRGELEVTLRRARGADEYKGVIESTLEEVVRLSRITEDLLLLARSDSGAITPRPTVTPIDAVVQKVVERLEGLAAEKSIRVSTKGPSGVVAQVDEGLLTQVVWNLLENGIKFTPEGGSVEVSIEESDDGVGIDVRDSGPGFLDPRQAFTRFYRDDTARTPRIPTQGTGLGLAIVQAVAEAHGGRATAANAPEGGAIVRVTLPAPANVDGSHPSAPEPERPARALDLGPDFDWRDTQAWTV